MLKPEVKEPSFAYIITLVPARLAFSANTLVFRVIWNVLLTYLKEREKKKRKKKNPVSPPVLLRSKQ